MRNKIFALIVSAFILGVFISSPLVYILSENGIITVDNVGNIIEVEKTYEEDFPAASFFNGIEEGKRVINDIYINYIPGYVPITTFTTSVFTSVNSGVTDFLGNWGNDIIRDSMESDDPFENEDTVTTLLTTEITLITDVETDGFSQIITTFDTSALTDTEDTTDTQTSEITVDTESPVVPDTSVTDEPPVITDPVVTTKEPDTTTTEPPTPETTTKPPVTTKTEPPVTTTEPTETTTEEPPQPPVNYRYSTSLVGKDSYHRLYRVIARGSNGQSKQFFCRVPAENLNKLKGNSQKQINMINSMADARPDVNFYVYIPTCLEDTKLGMDIFPAESTMSIFENFVSSMSDNVQIDYLKFDTLDERYAKYFATDHHWNRYGSYEGYCEIIDMMKENYSDFGDPRAIVKDYSFPDVKFHGSLCLGTNNYNLSDPFGVLDLGLPEHKLEVNRQPGYGGRVEFYTFLERYIAGEHSPAKSYNHFMEFYRIAKTIEYPENKTGRNLLLIGDSFSTCIAEALASHFDKTIVRYVDSTKPAIINYSKYIDDNNITDVLILETSSRVVLNLYGDALNNIRVED